MIFIPSYKRANDCKAARLLSKAIICCHESEVADYRKSNQNEIMAIPDALAGSGMGVIRNWILDNAKDLNVLMVDDDVSGIGCYEKRERIKLNEVQIYELIESAFRMCREAGTVLWGLNLLFDKQAYREYSPFSLTSVVLGPFMGIIKNDIRFDEKLGLKEDFDYSIQVLNRHRKVLRFNKYHYVVGHLVGKGGCIAYRTTARERQQREFFIRKWGSKIVKFKDGDINPIVKVPILGI